jgi:hypothetical protein
VIEGVLMVKKKNYKVSKEMKIHLRKQFSDITEEQKDFATGICMNIMRRAKEQVHDMHTPGVDSRELEVINMYRLLILNQIRFILEASDIIDKTAKED